MLLLLLRRSLLSPLFPYTTLFRSVDPYLPGRGADRGDVDSLRHPVGMLSRAADAIAVARVQRRASAGQRSDDLQDQPDPDRKSTRLNSSHRCISYAVFCLKKKKTR